MGTTQDYRYKETHVLGKTKEVSGKQEGRSEILGCINFDELLTGKTSPTEVRIMFYHCDIQNKGINEDYVQFNLFIQNDLLQKDKKDEEIYLSRVSVQFKICIIIIIVILEGDVHK